LAQMVTSYNGKLFGEVSYVSTRRATRPSLHRCRAGVA
jgi:hypothetical protein